MSDIEVLGKYPLLNLVSLVSLESVCVAQSALNKNNRNNSCMIMFLSRLKPTHRRRCCYVTSSSGIAQLNTNFGCHKQGHCYLFERGGGGVCYLLLVWGQLQVVHWPDKTASAHAVLKLAVWLMLAGTRP